MSTASIHLPRLRGHVLPRLHLHLPRRRRRVSVLYVSHPADIPPT